MEPLAKQEKLHLLQLARDTIRRQVGEGQFQLQKTESLELKQACGAFVTLHIEGELKGCIGRILNSDPLFEVIQKMAVAAATKDPRFQPVQVDEIDELEIEISVLSPPKLIQSYDEIEVGRDGLIVQDRGFKGLLLPQVATENGWDQETFLSHTCSKAGLPMDHWKVAHPILETFSAQVFSEKELLNPDKPN